MVTLVFLLLLSLLLLMVTIIDAYLYHISIYESLYTLITFYPGTRRWMLYVFVACGFIYAIVMDYRLGKQKKGKHSAKG